MTNKENVSKTIDIISQTVDTFVKERNKEIEELLTNLGERYFTCPAAGNEKYHSAYVGGLCVHSLHVTNRLFDLCNAFQIGEDEISNESKVITGLFHDIGKIGSLDGKPYYLDEKSDWHREKLGRLFTHNDELDDALSVPQRSIRILTQSGINLSDSEYQAILFHDGLFVEENRSYRIMVSKDKLMRLLHMADAWSAMVEGV